jgi:DNA-directed RNA polymerase subunit RPC12/RpoP
MDALIENSHAAPNASYECADCGKEYWTDEQPVRCTKCMSFTVRPTSLVPRRSAGDQTRELFAGKTQSEDDMAQRGPIEKLNAAGEVLGEYQSQLAAAAAVGISGPTVCSAVKMRSRAAGFYWRRKGDTWTPPATDDTPAVLAASPRARVKRTLVKNALAKTPASAEVASPAVVAPLPLNRALAALTGLAAGCELQNVKITGADLTIEIGTIRIGIKG